MVELREVPPIAQVNVRADAATAAALGLPLEPNTTAPVGGAIALWLGPDEWLLVGLDDDAVVLERELQAAAGDAWITTVDVSSNRSILALTGPAAREVLMKGCSLDLHPRAFGPGRCAQTGLARAQVILEPTDDDAYRIFVRRSFAGYLTAWLRDAMAEYLTRPPAAAPAPAPASAPFAPAR
jgi:sarcosine oxidase subunit gamma